MCSPHTVSGITPGTDPARQPDLAESPEQTTPAAGAGHPPRAALPLAELRGQVIDLTHVLGPDWPVFTMYVDPPEVRRLASLEPDEYNAFELRVNEHVGTHIDAPRHFDDEGLSVDRIPAQDLIAPLCVVRIGERAQRDNITELGVDDLLGWERAHGRIPAGAFVAMETGWAPRLHQPGAFLNFDEAEGIFRFPGIAPETAAFLVEDRAVIGVGTDTTSLDTGTRPATPETHRVLLPAGRYGIECLAGLDQVPDSGSLIIVGAPRHRDGTGGQARVFALV
ncbi:cyclase family protein [Frankia sp. AgKG'84/4]|uniref:cyclase family protein n=1 Tax=Frankia sp. AgKG'84/4 TaxID=573490 RepID=UPI00202A081C|nr:cyclase family protein [Frankia sp. AgKG'84/4]MCL9793378.1 cyclase family protein [Frankia sp. AgKG'84/4]